MTIPPRHLSDHSNKPTAWQELAEGAPTILRLACLCAEMLTQPTAEIELEELSREAKAILVLAGQRGTFDIRANRDSFDSADRFLAVCVEYELDQRRLFLQKNNPKQTVKFLEGFRELCAVGFVLHHLQRDFSLSSRGYAAATQLRQADYQDLIDFAVEVDG